MDTPGSLVIDTFFQTTFLLSVYYKGSVFKNRCTVINYDNYFLIDSVYWKSYACYSECGGSYWISSYEICTACAVDI